ncbi:MAG: hypothetical protein HY646_01600 [Acidobacteria bacterium]|nr:hypothetical protein [Acidobacteriota bacterium]
MRIHELHAALPKWRGNFPFRRGNSSPADTPERVHAAASSAGLDAFLQANAQAEHER